MLLLKIQYKLCHQSSPTTLYEAKFDKRNGCCKMLYVQYLLSNDMAI
jgi:hypothetical protein